MSARAIAIRPALSLFAASLLLVGLSGCHFFNVPGEFEREEEVAAFDADRARRVAAEMKAAEVAAEQALAEAETAAHEAARGQDDDSEAVGGQQEVADAVAGQEPNPEEQAGPTPVEEMER